MKKVKLAFYLIILITVAVISYRFGHRTTPSQTNTVFVHDTIQIPVHDTVIKWHEKIIYRESKPETVWVDTSHPIPQDSIKKGILYLKMTPKSLHIKGFVKGGNGFIPFSLQTPLHGDLSRSVEIIQTKSLMPSRAFMIREQRKWMNIDVNSGAILYPIQWSSVFLEGKISRSRFYLVGRVELTPTNYRYGIGIGYRLWRY